MATIDTQVSLLYNEVQKWWKIVYVNIVGVVKAYKTVRARMMMHFNTYKPCNKVQFKKLYSIIFFACGEVMILQCS